MIPALKNVLMSCQKSNRNVLSGGFLSERGLPAAWGMPQVRDARANRKSRPRLMGLGVRLSSVAPHFSTEGPFNTNCSGFLILEDWGLRTCFLTSSQVMLILLVQGPGLQKPSVGEGTCWVPGLGASRGRAPTCPRKGQRAFRRGSAAGIVT